MAYSEIQEAIENAAVYTLEDAQVSLWEEPDFRMMEEVEIPPPPLPIHLFGNFWQDWITVAAEVKSAPPDYVAAGLLSVGSTLIGNALWASAWSGWQEPPALWFACIGKPSSGKSPALDAPLDLLRALQKEVLGDYGSNQRTYETALESARASRQLWEKELKRAIADGKEAPEMPVEAEDPVSIAPPRLFTSDATTEAVIYKLVENPKGLLLIRDELSGWLGKMDKYGGGEGSDRAFWLEAYGGRSYVVDRVKHLDQLIHVPHTTVPIIGGIQPDRLETLLLGGDDDGLCARFNYIWPVACPPKRPSTIQNNLLAITALKKLHRLTLVATEWGDALEPGIMQLDSSAANTFQQFRLENHRLQEKESGLFLSYLGKQPGLVLRLSLIFELLWWCAQPGEGLLPTSISEAAILAAVEFSTHYLVPMAQRSLGRARLPKAEQDAYRIAKWIVSQNISAFNKRNDLQRNRGFHFKNTQEITPALQVLLEAGWIQERPHREGDRSGRQKADYVVNPRLFESKAGKPFSLFMPVTNETIVTIAPDSKAIVPFVPIVTGVHDKKSSDISEPEIQKNTLPTVFTQCPSGDAIKNTPKTPDLNTYNAIHFDQLSLLSGGFDLE